MEKEDFKIGNDISQQADLFNIGYRCKQANATLCIVKDPLLALARYSIYYNNNPAQKLRIIGVTGTKGKTTTTLLIAHILKTAGYCVGVISSICNTINDTVFDTQFTTPHADYLQVFLRTCVKHHVQIVVLETSAQASFLHRVHGIEFEYLVFTNFSQEHGEFFASQQDYFIAKLNLINQIKNKGLLIYNPSKLPVHEQLQSIQHVTYSINTNTDYSVTLKKLSLAGSQFSLNNDLSMTYVTPLIGEFNVENCTAALSVCMQLHISKDIIYTALSSFNNVAGRMEHYTLTNGAHAYIDNAHTPSSFEAVLSCLKSYTHNLIVVFGAGGDRDRLKRPEMAKVAAQYADHLIITTDNPRSEDPLEICNEIYGGIPSNYLINAQIILDRADAIHQAYRLSNRNSCIALLGKGNKEIQIYKDSTSYFSEKQIILSSYTSTVNS